MVITSSDGWIFVSVRELVHAISGLMSAPLSTCTIDVLIARAPASVIR